MWNLDSEIAFVDSLAHDKVCLRGYLRALAVRAWDFAPDRDGKRRPLNEGARDQLRGRAQVHLNDLLGA